MAGKVLSRYGEEIKAKADNAENLVYHGELPLDEINRLMSKAHLFVNTSKYEGFPNTFIQAWMNKTPVLSLNVDPDDIIERNGLGKLCGDFNTLKATIERMIQNDSDIQTIGEQCRTFAVDYFSLRNIEKLYKLICVDYSGVINCEK